MTYTFTDEHRQNISKALKGNKNHLGHYFSEETKQKMSLNRKGQRKPPLTPEQHNNMSVARQNYWDKFTEEEKVLKTAHLHNTTRGKQQTQEHIEKRMAKIRGIANPNKSIAMLGNSNGLGYKFTLEQCLANSEAHKGEKSYLWRGGMSFEPYPPDFNNNIRLRIRIRDNFTCQLCHIPENGHKHDIHHIDYSKHHNNMDNLVTLCHSCHTKTNQNRDYWQHLLAELIYNHFNRGNNA